MRPTRPPYVPGHARYVPTTTVQPGRRWWPAVAAATAVILVALSVLVAIAMFGGAA